MDLFATITRIVSRLDSANIHYALIGGLAMALRGVQRATFDADFLLLLADLETADLVLREEGYILVFHSENVSHYEKCDAVLNRIDILHAFRTPSLGMLERADRIPLATGCSIPVVRVEDLIGLKIQASVNNPARALGDWSDVHRLIKHSGERSLELDWELIADYLEIFRMTERITGLKALHHEAKRRGKNRDS